MSESPIVYLIYGIPGSGRREVLFDLIEGGVAPGSQVLYFKPEGEAAAAHDEQIEALDNVSVVPWQLKDGKVAHGKITAAPETILFIAPGDSDPADVAEALQNWSSHNQCELGRILTVVHSSFLMAEPKAQAWFDACIHFSDVVLLNRREEVDNKWVQSFEERYRKLCYPCRFILVKRGRVPNPPEVLNPEARRLSLFFDTLIPIEEDGLEGDELPEDQKPDKYIERLESGQRAYPVPDIRKWLKAE
ncbi:GTP-binding protein [Coraliomargarita parva]|uniref:GTP-binding protein n=1 Tax=Coraliomargarita parva TaxID=3014050 RepID=UPI0022B540FB|nr:hypothetical protein [Coraliomargarita parva]